MIMIATGIVAVALATVDHHRTLKRMHGEYRTGGRSVAIVVAAIVSGLGLLALGAALFRA